MRPVYRFGWATLRFFVRLLYGFRVEGAERIPRTGGMLLAVNHVSYADPVIAGIGVPRELHFFAKRELFRNPLFGGVIRAYNAVPVDRGALEKSTLAMVLDLLRGGGALLIFPEGTRSLDGEVRDARPGVGMMAAAASVPIVPTYLRGTRRMRRSLFRRGALAVFYGEPIAPGAFPGASRKERSRLLGEETMKRIRELQRKYG
jgi:1-acyl-sn-glycerol-3-phosphate acyltransferase